MQNDFSNKAQLVTMPCSNMCTAKVCFNLQESAREYWRLKKIVVLSLKAWFHSSPEFSTERRPVEWQLQLQYNWNTSCLLWCLCPECVTQVFGSQRMKVSCFSFFSRRNTREVSPTAKRLSRTSTGIIKLCTETSGRHFAFRFCRDRNIALSSTISLTSSRLQRN